MNDKYKETRKQREECKAEARRQRSSEHS